MYQKNTIIDEIKQSFKEGSYLTKLIYINIGVFVLLGMNFLVIRLMGMNTDSPFYLGNWMVLPSYPPELIKQPWSLVTYMFVHEIANPGGLIHILFNMMVLFWLGKIFLMFLDQKKLLSIYIMGGLSGAVLYLVAYNFIPAFSNQLFGGTNRGASAAVMAIVIAVAVYRPDMEFYLMFFGRVKLKYIALAYVIIDIISIAGSNAGGHIAHLGGALYGYYYISQYKKGVMVMKWFDRLLDSLFTVFKPRKRKIKISYKKPVDDYAYNAHKVAKQEEIDVILDKISKQGYDSLSKREKEILFKEGKG
jgi:membrane associated rhomboid family serine protease